MNRRGFLRGVFSAAAVAAMPNLMPALAGKSIAPQASTVRWTTYVYATPILFTPHKTMMIWKQRRNEA